VSAKAAEPGIWGCTDNPQKSEIGWEDVVYSGFGLALLDAKSSKLLVSTEMR
jgi:hypothetical protein